MTDRKLTTELRGKDDGSPLRIHVLYEDRVYVGASIPVESTEQYHEMRERLEHVLNNVYCLGSSDRQAQIREGFRGLLGL